MPQRCAVYNAIRIQNKKYSLEFLNLIKIKDTIDIKPNLIYISMKPNGNGTAGVIVRCVPC